MSFPPGPALNLNSAKQPTHSSRRLKFVLPRSEGRQQLFVKLANELAEALRNNVHVNPIFGRT